MNPRLKNIIYKGFVPAWVLAYLYFNFFHGYSFFSFFKNESQGPTLAEVTSFQRDVRTKPSESLDFKSAKEKEAIHRGDSLSTGSQSTAVVTFKSGHLLSVDQNSLIVFDEQSSTPEFVTGNIKLTVNGSMKIKINEEIVELNGRQSDIQIFNDPKTQAQKLVLLKGSAQVKSKKKTVQLEKNVAVDSLKNLGIKEGFNAKSRAVAKKLGLPLAEPTTILTKTEINPLPEPVALAQEPIPPPPPPPGFYRLYDYYQANADRSSPQRLNPNFVLKTNYSFKALGPSSLNAEQVADLTANPYARQFRLNAITSPAGHVVEISTTEEFSGSKTRYLWAGQKFNFNFGHSGTYYIRYRQVLDDQILSEYSPVQTLDLPAPVEKPVLAQKPTPVRKAKKVLRPRPEPEVVAKADSVERAPAAIEPSAAEPKAATTDPIMTPNYQSTLKLVPTEIFKNQNFSRSSVGLMASQSYLASGRQIANNNSFVQAYNLGLDLNHWFNRSGVHAAVNRSLVSQTAHDFVTVSELDYRFRFYNHIYVGGGVENFKNTQGTTDFVDSYNLYKLGLGASMPIFNFWSIDGDLAYGFNESKSTSILVSTKANYYLTSQVSLGLGFRGRKLEYMIGTQKNLESLSETYTIIRMHY